MDDAITYRGRDGEMHAFTLENLEEEARGDCELIRDGGGDFVVRVREAYANRPRRERLPQAALRDARQGRPGEVTIVIASSCRRQDREDGSAGVVRAEVRGHLGSVVHALAMPLDSARDRNAVWARALLAAAEHVPEGVSRAVVRSPNRVPAMWVSHPSPSDASGSVVRAREMLAARGCALVRE